MLHLGPDKCNAEYARHHVPCPSCGTLGKLRSHTGYHRSVVDVDGDRMDSAVERRDLIGRVICLACRSTHALLPRTLVPYRPFTVRLCMLIALWCLRGDRGAPAASRAFRASVRTCREIARTDAAKSAYLLGVAMSDLAGALEEAAGDAPAFARSFGRAYGRAPYSHVTLPQYGLPALAPEGHPT